MKNAGNYNQVIAMVEAEYLGGRTADRWNDRLLNILDEWRNEDN